MAANPFDLRGLTAFVTGAGRGLGRGCALALHAAGAQVIGAARTQGELQTLVDEMGSGEFRVLDMTDSGAVRDTIGALPALDILVNNAGWNRPQHTLDVDDETFDTMVDLNMRSVFVAAQAAARRMAHNGGGSIINMSSQMGHVGGPLRSVYCMTKWGVEGMTRAMAVDMAAQNVRVNTVAPTFVSTPLADKFLAEPAFHDFVLGSIPLGRLATVAEVAAAVVYLASPGAASITGTSIVIDGGWTAK
jgi:NAD(P)-dependent dehydrogenase (short-subunit alcohol dehydrogenase family)